MTEKEWVNLILKELRKAEEKHPIWPLDLIHSVAIVNEESGEAIKAALNHTYENKPLSDVVNELIQTGAMVIRCLNNIEKFKKDNNERVF